ncbi:hypothetical protein D3C81_2172210 [compost metagenome]
MNASASWRQLKKRQFVQHAFEVDRGLFADQFQLEFEWRVECLTTGKRQHLEIAVDAIDGQIEMRLVGR